MRNNAMKPMAEETVPMLAPTGEQMRARQHALELENATLRQLQAALENAKAHYVETEHAVLAETLLRAKINHDLRQPLSALGIYVHVLKSHVAPAGQPLLAQIQLCLATLSELLAK